MQNKLTKAQQRALLSVYRSTQMLMGYIAFCGSVVMYPHDSCTIVYWRELWFDLKADCRCHT